MQIHERFKIVEFTNPSGKRAWRVSGSKFNGDRVRENYKSKAEAIGRQSELETEFHNETVSIRPKLTALSDERLRLAEVAFQRLGSNDAELVPAVEYWMAHGRKRATVDAPSVGKAVEQFLAWLETTTDLRAITKPSLRLRVGSFGHAFASVKLSDVERDSVHGYLAKLDVAPGTRDNHRRALSRFFSWCGEHDRQWITANPAHGVKVEGLKASKSAKGIAILSVKESAALMTAAERFEGGKLVPYAAACLFGGLRPFEVRRLTWSQVNLADSEIRIEAAQSKVKRSRTISINPTLKTWLVACKGKPFFPSNWRKDFDVVKESIGYGTATRATPKLKPWVPDLMRHTAISHLFRASGSYGLTAEQSGNSEAIIKAHYQGKVSTSDTEAFYTIMPKGARKPIKPKQAKATKPPNIIPIKAA